MRGIDDIADTEREDSVQVWSVSELNRAVRDLLEQTLQPFWVRGEISNLTIHRSGHVYFSLKDERCQIAAVFFRGAELARQLELRNGLAVEVWGRVSIYEPRGTYQIVVSRLRAKGTGLLQQRFEELKRRLREEGLFDDERKRPIPVLPRCVGVVTSPAGAAVRDFLQILNRRFAEMHVRIHPAAVQGDGAAAEIVGGIRFFNETRTCDVIVVTRGGGSLEDLWPFNEEIVARAVASSQIPVVSAVGHERDFTICDFAADLRVPTPSAAAELVIARKAELEEQIRSCRHRMSARLELQLSECRRRFERAAGSPVFREPGSLVRMYQQRLDELALRVSRACAQQAEAARSRLARLTGTLEALNPRKVLNRGYAILIAEQTGLALRSAGEAREGDKVRGVLAEGELKMNVEQVLDLPAPAAEGCGCASV